MSSASTRLDKPMSNPAVVILGAGLGGLTLGRCLRRKGITSVIYDRASQIPRHAYGITLYPSTYKLLSISLGLDEDALQTQLKVDSVGIDGNARVPPQAQRASTTFRANRSKLESMLREEQDIMFEYQLSSAAIPEDGDGVELSFKNGTKLRPGLVVDAMGVHSPLRKALLPHIEPDVEPFAVYSGKRYVDSDVFSSTFACSFKHGPVVVRQPERSDEPRLEVSINDRQANSKVSISYVYSRAARSVQEGDPLHRPQRANAGATDIPEELYEELESFMEVSQVDQAFRDCFDVGKLRSERLLHWLMRTIRIPKEDLLRLAKHGIVSIGDAVHAVPILGGHGANMAILDAIKLADVLAGEDKSSGSEAFYESNWPSWDTAVKDSKANLAAMHQVSAMATPNL